MGWVRLDDQRALNRKLREAGFEARGLDEAALCLVSGDETDGYISDDSVAMLAVAHGCKRASRPIERLLAVGRWTRDAERKGYWIHDYDQFNPTKDQLEEMREKKRVAGQAGGRRSGQARREAGASANGLAGAKANGAALGQPAAQAPRAGTRLTSRSPVVQNQTPAVGETHDAADPGPERRDLDSVKDRPGNGDTADPLVERLYGLCVGENRPTVHLEAAMVVSWATGSVGRNVVDEAVGVLATLPAPPVMPVAVVPLIERRAASAGIVMAPFVPLTKSIDTVIGSIYDDVGEVQE